MFSDRLGTARLEEAAWIAKTYPHSPGTFWIGRAIHGPAIGYDDDRHVCVVSGTRGGKGNSIVINNLCLWPGSVVVIDPKGENATVTAARRGQGDEYCTGMGQDVHVLDPFKAATVDDCYRSSFNPLAALDIEDEQTIKEASRIAAALVVVDDTSESKTWDEKARTLLRAVILHVLSADAYDGQRNLLTVAKLVRRGDQKLTDMMRDAFPDKPVEPPHLLLFRAMQQNPAFDGVVADIGAEFHTMLHDSAKQFQGVLHSATTSMEFLDTPGMRRVLSGQGRTFRLSDLKTNPRGVSLYLCLPLSDLRDTYYRWLRMMVDLITTQMEITRVKPPYSKAAPTATGYRLLMILDEFKSLRRMGIIEEAAAQIAGFGMKIVFIVQTLAQLHEVYKDGWETFLSNSGLKIAFSIDDNFSRDYFSKHIGDTEIIRELQSSNQSQSRNESFSKGTSKNETVSTSTTEGQSTSYTKGKSSSTTHGKSLSHNTGTSQSVNQSKNSSANSSSNTSESLGSNQSAGWSEGISSGENYGMLGPQDIFEFFLGVNRQYLTGSSEGRNSSISGSQGTSSGISRGTSNGFSSGTSSGITHGTSNGFSSGTSDSTSSGTSESLTEGQSTSKTEGFSTSTGISKTRTQGSASSTGSATTQSLQRRPLFHPDEVGRAFPRVDDKSNIRYPGLALVMISGGDPIVLRRAQYFEDLHFIDCFSPHPDHGFMSAVPHAVEDITPYIEKLEAAMDGTYGACLTISRWFIRRDEVTFEKYAARIDHVPPYNRSIYIETPGPGKVSEFPAAQEQNKLSSGEYLIPDGPLFTIKNYSETALRDPLKQLRQACIDLEEFQKRQRQPKLVFNHAPIPAPRPVLALPPVPQPPISWQGKLLVWAVLIAGMLLSMAAMMAFGFGVSDPLHLPQFVAVPIGLLIMFSIIGVTVWRVDKLSKKLRGTRQRSA